MLRPDSGYVGNWRFGNVFLNGAYVELDYDKNAWGFAVKNKAAN
jgi:hypothetical protein